MTKNTFKFLYTVFMKVVLIVLLALFAITTIKNVLTIIGLFGFSSVNLELDIAGLVLSLFFVVVIVFMLAHSRYVVTNYSLIVRMGIFSYKIPCGLISSIVKVDNDDTLFILYVTQKAKPAQLKINVNKEDYDALISALRGYNSDIVYETVTLDKKEK